MNLNKYKLQHIVILSGIERLRELTRNGILPNAAGIARQIVSISGTVKLHLSLEDSSLYPAVASSKHGHLARIGSHYQAEMGDIAHAYFTFARAWNTAERIAAEPDEFRSSANQVLRALHDRIQREDHEFYPAIETPGAAF